MKTEKYNLIGYDQFSSAKIEKKVLCNTEAKIKAIAHMKSIILKNGHINVSMFENSINFDFKIINIIKL